MSFLLSLLNSQPYITPPSLAGWVVWFALLGVLVWLGLAWRGLAPERRRLGWIGLLLLAAAVPLTGLFAGMRMPAGTALPLPGLPAEPGVTRLEHVSHSAAADEVDDLVAVPLPHRRNVERIVVAVGVRAGPGRSVVGRQAQLPGEAGQGVVVDQAAGGERVDDRRRGAVGGLGDLPMST